MYKKITQIDTNKESKVADIMTFSKLSENMRPLIGISERLIALLKDQGRSQTSVSCNNFCRGKKLRYLVLSTTHSPIISSLDAKLSEKLNFMAQKFAKSL